MQQIRQSIIINRPVEIVFAFAVSPKNTPKWVDSIVVEQTNEWPVKVGTIYRSQNHAGEWSELELTAFEPNRAFTMRLPDGGYVSYEFSAPDAGTTKLDYVWASDGQLDAPFLNKILLQLKTVLEATE